MAETADLTLEPIPGSEPIRIPNKHGLSEENRITARFLERVSTSYDYHQDNIYEANSDIEFAYNNQWDNHTLVERIGRPTLQINLINTFINLLVGNLRQQKFSVNVKQTSGPNVPIPLEQAGTLLTPAEVMEGIIRQIEHHSKAHIQYCLAAKDAIDGGFGWLKIKTFFPDEHPQTHLSLIHI